ncbi:restriction endonuclease subunit S [Prevotella communis]|uniref:restriction endonuclease subunit S n=1 Tax=Prevotella communis TaxID=2913614 RepID=UPI001EDA76FD|nr:restriction endonuclease subunit S [Prevotella communis]UKK57920.1 restriction endonuclease subunit S [Prevotella communis]
MKEGWEYKKLGDVANFISGYTPNKEEISNQGKYPYFKVAEMNIAGNELFMRNTSLFVNSPKRIYPKGSIIFPKNGGAIYTEKKRILEVDSVIDLNTEALFPTAQVELMYLFFLLTFTKISSFDKGGGLPSLDIKKMSESIIPVPPLSEQQSIVDYLNSVFAKIDAMKANAEKALNEAKALFLASLKEMLEPKEGWEEKALKDFAIDMYRGSGVKRDQVTEDGIPCVRYGEIYTKYNYHFNECDSHTLAEYVNSPKYFEYGDILFAITGESVEDIGKSIAYTGKDKCIAGGDMVVMKHSYEPRYISYALSTPSAIKQKGHGKTKLKVVHTNIPSLKEIIIPIAPIGDQKHIADTLDSLKSKVDKLQENYDKISQECDALKQAILRQVFE